LAATARSRAGVFAALVLALVLLSGCQVNTVVTIDTAANGHGTVSVRVTMDQSAVQAVGGLSALAGQLDVSDLQAAGWSVSGPSPGPNSSAVLTASHTFSTPAEAAQLVADLAGSGPASGRPFKLALSRRSSFWHVYTGLSGTVNLTCGLGCFGDSGLRSALGSATGVNPSPLEAQTHETPAQAFTFGVKARLPGATASSNASTRDGGVFSWTPVLGRTLVLSATTQEWNWPHLILLFVLAGIVVVGLLVLAVWMWRSRRRRRKRPDDGSPPGRPRRGAHAKPRRGIAKAVTSHS